jgi:hypothetical protein
MRAILENEFAWREVYARFRLGKGNCGDGAEISRRISQALRDSTRPIVRRELT